MRRRLFRGFGLESWELWREDWWEPVVGGRDATAAVLESISSDGESGMLREAEGKRKEQRGAGVKKQQRAVESVIRADFADGNLRGAAATTSAGRQAGFVRSRYVLPCQSKKRIRGRSIRNGGLRRRRRLVAGGLEQ